MRSHRTDTGFLSKSININNEYYFQPYIGKIIRKINIRQFNFDQSFDDTTQRSKYFGTKILSSLHNSTKNWVIRQNIYLKENEPLSAVLAADNERYLRTLQFIRDARILVDTIPGVNDSIDITVLTKDLFSITGRVSNLSGNRQKVTAGNVNFLGAGQTIQATVLHENDRTTKTGVELLYQKTNIKGSFLNYTALYSTIKDNLYNARNNEAGYGMRLDMPLISQYTKWSGSLGFWNGKIKNYYAEPDSILDMYRYHYKLYDGWIGWNIGTKNYINDSKMRARKFLSLRYFNYHFLEAPQFDQQYNLKYNDRAGLLGQFTFFQQDFYKTQYLYGFGVTEDIPYGYNISVTGGYYRQLHLRRPYAGIDANKYRITAKGAIFQYFLRAGAYYRKGIEDVNLLIGSSMYSPLLYWNRSKLRQLLRLSYSEIFDPYAADPLLINNSQFGLPRLNSDSVAGRRRISLHSETILFTPVRYFGFAISPFLSGDIAFLAPYHNPTLERSFVYQGIGGGLRIRNENLVFGTIELRGIYFPRAIPNENRLKIGIKTNLRFRYNSNYVNAPDIIQMNGDIYNSIY